jgi:hypothetical protein
MNAPFAFFNDQVFFLKGATLGFLAADDWPHQLGVRTGLGNGP